MGDKRDRTFAGLTCAEDILHDLRIVKIDQGKIHYACANCLFVGILNTSNIEEAFKNGGD